jgi:hypothetical protein
VRPVLFIRIALVVVTAVLALASASVGSSGATQPGFATTSQPAGKVSVRYTVTRFVRRGDGLVAYGRTFARYIPASAGAASTTSKPFRAVVKARAGQRQLAAAQTICPILTLDLQQLDLNLLGLVVHADRVFLTLTADSAGGALGSLLCGLSNSGKLTQQASRLNWVVRKSGLTVAGTGFSVSVAPAASGVSAHSSGMNARSAGVAAPLALCPVLELTLGPLDANLLGLLVHLDQVHLTIIANSDGGILGSLFCQVAGGGA